MARTVRIPEAAAPMPAPAPSLIRWGAVLAGVAIGLSMLIVLSLIWMATAFETGVAAVAANLAWYVGASAVVAMLVGGFVSGWLSGVPGAVAGFFNGLTVWALILVGALALGVPGLVNVVGVVGFDPALAQADILTDIGLAGNPLWASVISLLIGAVVAGLGGLVGGMITHPAMVAAAPVPARTETVTERRAPQRPREPAGPADRGEPIHDGPAEQPEDVRAGERRT